MSARRSAPLRKAGDAIMKAAERFRPGRGPDTAARPERFHQRMWSRLNAAEFMDSSFVFAALAILCLFPFLITLSSAFGSNFADVVVTRMGLSRQAAADVSALFPRGGAPLATLTVSGFAFLVVGFVAMGSTLQSWYRKVFDQPQRGWREVVYGNFTWSASLLAYFAVQVALSGASGPAGSRLLTGLVQLAVAIVFWWWTPWVLLLGAVPWRTLLPAGVATAVCYAGLGAFAAFFFSSAIVSNHQSYGDLGTIMIFLSFLIGLGVVVHLGAVLGQMYNERYQRFEPEASGRRG